MGCKNSERTVTKVADSSIIIKDTFHKTEGVIEKQKLVQLYPAQFSWVSTHLTGPNKYSQFLYKILADGPDRSILDFTALHLEYDSVDDAVMLSVRLCKEDLEAWKLLAKALITELREK